MTELYTVKNVYIDDIGEGYFRRYWTCDHCGKHVDEKDKECPYCKRKFTIVKEIPIEKQSITKEEIFNSLVDVIFSSESK